MALNDLKHEDGTRNEIVKGCVARVKLMSVSGSTLRWIEKGPQMFLCYGTYVVKEAGDIVDLAFNNNPSRVLCRAESAEGDTKE